MSTTFEDFSKHLEFLGYEVSVRAENSHWVTAKHAKKLDLMLRDFRRGVLLGLFFPASKKCKEGELEYYRLLNTYNEASLVSKWYLGNDLGLIVEAWYPGPYDKTAVAEFMENWNKEVDLRIWDDWEKLVQYWLDSENLEDDSLQAKASSTPSS